MMKSPVLAGLTGLLAFALASAAFAQGNVHGQISTAHAHALMASNADTVKMAQTHLHHVINCLVGPDGGAFDASAGNPCKDQGHGAMPDASSNSRQYHQLKGALAAAEAGLRSDSLATIHEKANKAATILQAAASTPASAATAAGSSW